MPKVEQYQANVVWDTPELQAKKRALKIAWIPKDIKEKIKNDRRRDTNGRIC